MNDLRLNDIRNFVTCAKFSTMGEAARHLNIAQPSLSESILRLEDDLGAKLFYRSRSGISLTPEGRSVLVRAKNALIAVAEVKPHNTIDFEKIVCIGCHATVGSYALPNALLELQKTAPYLNIKIRHGLSRNIQSDVQSRKVDIGIVINAVKMPDLIIKKLGFDEVSVWKTSHKNFNSNILLLDPELFQSQLILKRWRNHPLKWIESSSLELIARLTHAGYGFGILPGRAVEISQLDLIKIDELPTFRDEISLVYQPEFGKQLFEKMVVTALQNAFL